MKKKLYIFLLSFTLLSSSISAKSYLTDIANNWAKNYIEDLYENNLIKGYEDNTFRPNNYILNVEVYSIVNRIAKFKDEDNIKIKKDAKWYESDLRKANRAGYAVIDDDFEIKPITRIEMVEVISKVYNLKDKNGLTYFKDCYSLSSKERRALSSLVENNIIEGYPDNTFRPYQTLTRAEFSKIISESKEKYKPENNSNIDGLYVNIKSNEITAPEEPETGNNENNKIPEETENKKLTLNIRDTSGEKIKNAEIKLNDKDFTNGDSLKPGNYLLKISAKGMENYQTYVIMKDENKTINITLSEKDDGFLELTLSEGLHCDKNEFKKNERVEIKILIPDGEIIKSFTVNGEKKKPLSDTFSFFITEDTTVNVQFEKK